MAEVSGNPIVNRTDSVAASYLKTQDIYVNPTSGNQLFAPPNITLNLGNTSGASTLNFAGSFTGSGRTLTAAASGLGWAPVGFVCVQVSGNPVGIPFFTL